MTFGLELEIKFHLIMAELLMIFGSELSIKNHCFVAAI